MRGKWVGLACALLATTAPIDRCAADDTLKTQRRMPVALALQGDVLWVANQRSGSISQVFVPRGTVLREMTVAGSLRDIALLPGTSGMLALDDEKHELLLLVRETLQPVAKVAVARFPVRIGVSTSGDRIAVASLWSRRLTLIRHLPGADPQERSPLSVVRTLDLDFAPREICVLPADGKSGAGERFVVADAFGGRLLVIDARTGDAVGAPSIAGHHLHGMALQIPASTQKGSGALLVSHQVLNSDTSTTHEHVFWGGVIGNRLRSLALAELMTQNRKEPAPGSVDVLGRPSAAAGDPSGIAVSRGGATVVALSGINEVAVRRRPDEVFTEIAVGRRPTRVVLSEDESTAIVANSFDDSLTFIDLQKLAVAGTVELGPRPSPTLAERGERLFYDSRLSLDGWYSCHSCHTDGHTNGLLNDNLGDEYFGAPKKILSLLGTGETSPWAWNGGSASLETQIGKSLRVTMQAEEADASDDNIQAIKAYLLTLSPPPGIDAARERIDEPTVARGKAVFRKQGCVECHGPETYTTGGRFDVGIHDERGMKEFNPPSLRGVSQRAPYFHDNRARDLEDVLDRFRHGQKSAMDADDRRALLAFLRSL